MRKHNKNNNGIIIKSEEDNERLLTGKTTAKSNIFDMGGNIIEFTTEINPGILDPIVLRRRILWK